MPIAVVPWRPLAIALAVVLVGAAAGWRGDLVGVGSATGAVVGYLVGACWVALTWRRPRLGVANTVTLARVVGTSWVLAFVFAALGGDLAETGVLLLILIGSACLVLDGVDGHVARRRGEASPFGARFDMETDSAFVLVLSLVVAAFGVAGWWVLAIGGMRYGYLVAGWLVPALRTPLPVRLSRKVVAVLQGVALLAALASGPLRLPEGLPAAVLLPALGLLCWSFGRDVRWQLRVARAWPRLPRR